MADDVRYLDVPFDERYDASNLGAKYDSRRKTWYAPASAVKAIERYGSDDFSYQRWLEDTHNRHIRPFTPGSTKFTPHPHQKQDGELILKAWEQGRQGFLIASGTGVGKTLSMIAGTCNIARKAGFTPMKRMKVLIVCPKSVIPSWRNTLRAYADTILLRVMVINYQQLNKLIKEPASAKTAKTKRTKNRRTARNGEPKINFNVIIFDEEQYLKNYPDSAVSMAANTIAQMGTSYRKGEKPFVISGTATPGTNPLELAMMAPWLSTLINPSNRKYTAPSAWGQFLADNGFHVKKGKTGWSWSQIPWYGSKNDKNASQTAAKHKIEQEHAMDVKAIGKALKTPSAPYIQRKPSDIAGWPTQQAIELPMDIGLKGMTDYMLAWTQFRAALKLAASKNDSKSPLVEALRFRQKASLLKAPGIAEFAIEQVKSGNQVFIGCEFMETIDMIESKLKSARIPFAEYSGRNETNREQERLRFQKGEAKIILCTTVAGVSFHAGEKLPDGSNATTADRITILADVRNRVLDTMQQMGRCHRDGQNSVCYIPYAEKTVDEKVIGTFVMKIRDMKGMLADDGRDFLNDLLMDDPA